MYPILILVDDFIMEQFKCLFCERNTSEHNNYCSWDCHIAHARELGGKEITPNNLPIVAIRGSDNALMEHEHAEHPDYKFPITVKYFGAENKQDFPDEIHAIIYCDGYVVLSLWEYTYHLFDARTGVYLNPNRFWYKDYKIASASLKLIKERLGKFLTK